MCFTSGAVGINCSYSVEMRSLLGKILISKGAGFFINSYHTIPGDQRGRSALLIYELFLNLFFFKKKEAAKKIGLNHLQNKGKGICPVKHPSSSFSAFLFGAAEPETAFQREMISPRASSERSELLSVCFNLQSRGGSSERLQLEREPRRVPAAGGSGGRGNG